MKNVILAYKIIKKIIYYINILHKLKIINIDNLLKKSIKLYTLPNKRKKIYNFIKKIIFQAVVYACYTEITFLFSLLFALQNMLMIYLTICIDFNLSDVIKITLELIVE
jgi:hypothetical protein